MSRASRLVAGIILLTVPTVAFGGANLLLLLLGEPANYADNELRRSLFRAGHAHAGVYLVLALVMLRWVDDARLPDAWRWLVRLGPAAAAILIPAAFFLSVASPTATEPNALVHLTWIGATLLVAAVLTLGVGLIRAARHDGP